MNTKKMFGLTAGLVIASLGTYKLLAGKEPAKYSEKWFSITSDDVLKAERDVVRKHYRSLGSDYSAAIMLECLLQKFDSVLSKRAWNGEIPRCPNYPREHGHNLFKPD